MARLVTAVEVTLDTSQWTEDWWSEIDAIRLEGTPPPSGQSAEGGGGEGPVGPVETWLERMPWETDRAFAARARFEKERYGATPPTTPEESMRRAALSMVHFNMTQLGCSYPKAVEEEVAQAAGTAGLGLSRRVGSTGMAVEGELRAQAEARLLAGGGGGGGGG